MSLLDFKTTISVVFEKFESVDPSKKEIVEKLFSQGFCHNLPVNYITMSLREDLDKLACFFLEEPKIIII